MTGLIERNNVCNVNDLSHFIDKKTKLRKRLYHYTSLESLIKILKKRQLLLNNLINMNDKMEHIFCSKYSKESVYVASFTYYSIECTHYWTVYGKGSIYAIRVSFDLKKFINPETFSYLADDRKITINRADLKELIYYNSKLNKWRNASNYFHELNEKEDIIRDKLRGLCKYNVWEHEKEIRLIAFTNEKYKSIFVNLNDDIIRSLKITFSPWIDDIVCLEIENMLYHILLSMKINKLPNKKEIFKRSNLFGQMT